MKSRRRAVSVALTLLGLTVALHVHADERRVRIRVRVGEAAESRLIVAEGHKGQVHSSNVTLELVPTAVREDEVILSLTIKDAYNKVVAAPRLKGKLGEQMKLALSPESSSPVALVLTAERLD